MAMAVHSQRIMSEHTIIRRIATCIYVAGVGFAGSAVAGLLITFFIPDPTLEVTLGVAGVAGAAGKQTFDFIGRKILWVQPSGKEQPPKGNI
jgi:hypothetical protein